MISFLLCLAILIGGYFVYGKIVDNTFGPDDRETPAVRINDGVDYVVMPQWKLFLVQLLNIAGLGPIFGALQGALWGPVVFLWITFGTIFAGGVHDYFSGMMSERNDGGSIAEITGKYLGPVMQNVMRVFSVVLLIMVGTVFAVGPAGLIVTLCKNNGMSGVLATTLFWLIIILVYYFIATFISIDAVIGKIYPIFGICLIIMAVGVIFGIFTNPAYTIPEIWEHFGSMHPSGTPIWSFMFITVACGAISGFHCMISTGTTPKMLMNERSILPVGYGAMLTESFVGMMALIAACSLVPNDYFAINSTAEHFQALGIQVVDLPQLNAMVGEDVAHRPGGAVSLAVGMAFIFSNIPGLDHLMNYWYHFCIMFEALFIMTIIDAGTRVGRYMLQELIGRVWPKFGDPHWLPGGIVASALISGAWGYIVLQGNLSTIWPIFGVSNQLLAIITLAISTVVICAMGKARFAWVTVIPWIFLTVVIFWADYLNMFNIYLPKQEWLLFGVSAIMAILVIIVSVASARKCFELAKTVPPSYDTSESVEAEELKHLQELVKSDPIAKRFKELTVDQH